MGATTWSQRTRKGKEIKLPQNEVEQQPPTTSPLKRASKKWVEAEKNCQQIIKNLWWKRRKRIHTVDHQRAMGHSIRGKKIRMRRGRDRRQLNPSSIVGGLKEIVCGWWFGEWQGHRPHRVQISISLRTLYLLWLMRREISEMRRGQQKLMTILKINESTFTFFSVASCRIRASGSELSSSYSVILSLKGRRRGEWVELNSVGQRRLHLQSQFGSNFIMMSSEFISWNVKDRHTSVNFQFFIFRRTAEFFILKSPKRLNLWDDYECKSFVTRNNFVQRKKKLDITE